jgi:hypothetical protein
LLRWIFKVTSALILVRITERTESFLQQH